LSVSKALAKLCSKFRKPAGFTAVEGRHIHLLLQRTPLDRVWGFGSNTVNLLRKFGLRTAWDYVTRPEEWAARLLHKPGRELWRELRGHSVWPVDPSPRDAYATMASSKTFTPPSAERARVYARLLRNAEVVFARARRHRLRAGALGIVLRRQDFSHDGLEARLPRATAAVGEAVPLIRALFERAFVPGVEYRATLVALGRMEADEAEQLELFGDRNRAEEFRRASEAADAVNRRYGRHAVCLATALDLGEKSGARDAPPPRRALALPGETPRRRLALPRWNVRV
jgi:nucleotidyltransferase/DNA polymerase involved in DNA repair